MSGEIWLGVDPDLHHTGVAIADGTRVYEVHVITVDKALKNEKAVIAMCGVMADRLYEIMDNFTAQHPSKTLVGLVVESQRLLSNQANRSKPDDLINLACVTGAALASAPAFSLKVERPRPSEWKGEKPKVIHQAQLCSHYGWKYEKHVTKREGYCAPVIFGEGTQPAGGPVCVSEWKHVMDAIGLAKWASTRVTIDRLEAEIDG